ncbi:MAG TPA: hypothetical protein VK915_13510 [Gaiellaceae bacterium]|nr:hypothetical protein [Gaiellaceae bacterium]
MGPGDGDVSREERLARNEVLFREVNERIEEVKSPQDEATEFLCECGRRECTETIALTKAEYEAVRADATTFAVVPGHEIPDIETVVHRAGGYSVVRKDEDESEIAREHDPRSRG